MISGRVRASRALVVCAAAASAAILAAQLLVRPIVGLANNGDFERVMSYAGLRYTSDRYEDKYFTHVVSKFAYAPVWERSGYLTSETLLARGAREASRPFSKDGLFDLRWLGALHAALVVAGITLLVAAAGALTIPAQAVAAALLVFFFTDVGYAAPLNSFYSQAASVAFLLPTAGLAALGLRRGRLDGGLLAAFAAAAAGFVASKPQESLHGPLLALLALRLAPPGRAGRLRGALAAAALCGVAVLFYRSIPDRSFREVALYRSVFEELLRDSPDPAGDLAALGADPSLAVYAGRSAYAADAPLADPAFRRAFFDRVGYRGLLRFYAARPGRLAARLARAAPGAVRLRPGALGNFERDAPGYAPNRTTGRFGLWSRIRVEPRSGRRPVARSPAGRQRDRGGGGMERARASARGRQVREAMLVLVGMAAVELAVCVLADSLESVHRHLFTFHALCDLLLAADAAWLVQLATRSRNRRERRVSLENPPRRARVDSARERTNRFAVAAAVLAAAAILSLQLFVPPVVGLADNGDFDRVMRSVGLDYAASTRAERYVNWALTKFRRVAPDAGSRAYASSEAPLAAVAVAVADRFGATGTFDMRFLAAVHVVLLLLAIGLLVASTRELAPWVQWLAAAMLVLLFTDVGYAAPLNSMYTQVAGFLFFMVKAGIAAIAIRRGGASRGQLFAYFAVAALFVMSKPQEAIHGLLARAPRAEPRAGDAPAVLAAARGLARGGPLRALALVLPRNSVVAARAGALQHALPRAHPAVAGRGARPRGAGARPGPGAVLRPQPVSPGQPVPRSRLPRAACFRSTATARCCASTSGTRRASRNSSCGERSRRFTSGPSGSATTPRTAGAPRGLRPTGSPGGARRETGSRRAPPCGSRCSSAGTWPPRPPATAARRAARGCSAAPSRSSPPWPPSSFSSRCSPTFSGTSPGISSSSTRWWTC